MKSRCALSIVAAVALSPPGPASAAVSEPRLFGSRAAVANAASVRASGPGVVRSRLVSLNPAALPASRGVGRLPPAGQTIVLNLFPGVTLRARLSRAQRLA